MVSIRAAFCPPRVVSYLICHGSSDYGRVLVATLLHEAFLYLSEIEEGPNADAGDRKPTCCTEAIIRAVYAYCFWAELCLEMIDGQFGRHRMKSSQPVKIVSRIDQLIRYVSTSLRGDPW